ncbi:hypothetical protein AMK59_726 [Oryctes borbonicus]|uniref:Uncharacterized protein n=1 Tax=Oryctes borbonicus TaxID=1629725 RepID=A0A0T6BDG2_9SCAR|nr:hypothetical protein AMK59_726 [Oryctes borbonicus]
MRFTKTVITLLFSMILSSVFLANITNFLSEEFTNDLNNGTLSKNRIIPMSDTPDHLIWFLQISDIHISIFRDPSRITEFKEFCDQTVDVIQPSLVLASGDLTDAKTSDNIGSKQVLEEWVHYRNILHECNIEEKTLWLDIRGNHDNFNVINIDSKENFFPNYSIQGKTHPRSYMYQIKRSDTTYSFIGIDACLEPGPRRPFNFVGLIDKAEIDEINKITDVVRTSGSNYTVWFGHFPTSCIVATEGKGVKSIIGQLDQSLVYVCGHLHTLGGIVPNMYTLQKSGFLELELGDWKDNRKYRLMAIDHGLLSFVDVTHRDWPVILVTNPKHSLFHIPGKENFDVVKNSTHVRLLVFSLSQLDKVEIAIDNKKWKKCHHIEGPLYVAEWNPKMFSVGLHYIHVFVKDADGRQKFVKQPFSMDGTRGMSFGILSKLALMTDASSVFKSMFGSTLVLSILPLVLCRVLHDLVKAEKIDKPNLRGGGFIKRWLRNLWILSTIDRIFWPMVLYPMYLSFGPWSIGHIIEDHIGIIFAWGIYIDGILLPGSFTYAYGFLQLITFQIPLTLILANGVNHRYKWLILKPGKPSSIYNKIKLHLPFVMLMSLQIFMAYFFWLAYGTLAFILGPLRTWSIILAAILWQQALTYPDRCIRSAADVWDIKRTTSLTSTDLSLKEENANLNNN